MFWPVDNFQVGKHQADAEQAFIQPLLDDDVHMYIFVPAEMRTIEMRQNCRNVINSVFRLRRPLYGWSRSGNIWESHLSKHSWI